MKSALGLAIVFALWGCSRSGPPVPPEATANVAKGSLGNVMVGIARRFELAGRAVKANRFELAEFEVGEIEESFEADVPNAELPKEGPTAHIPAMAKSFLLANAPELRRAAAAKDPAAFAAAFQHAAAVCNACHQAAAKGFIQVPSEPGEAVPDLRPASAPQTPPRP